MRFVILVTLLVGPMLAQRQAVDEANTSVRWAGRTVKIGQTRTRALAGMSSNRKIVNIPGAGITILFGARDTVTEIIARAPFQGRTLKGVGVGSSGGDLSRAYPGVAIVNGSAQAEGVLFHVDKTTNKVTAIRVNGRKAARNRGSSGVQLRTTTVIWDRTWQATAGKQWVDAPGDAWPTDRGKLLVRVAYGRGVVQVDQLHAGILRPNTPADDLPTPVDFIVENISKRGGRGHTWKWAASGRGRIRVQIIWFPREKDLEKYQRRSSFAQFLASVRRPEPRPPIAVPGHEYPRLAAKVALLWEQTWDTHQTSWAWMKGPHRTWSEDGALLVRAWGSRHVQEIAWRVGPRGRTHLEGPGDHLIDTTVLPEPHRNPLAEVFGLQSRQRLHFGARGHGRVRVQVFWIPRRGIARRWCREHPVEPVVFDPPVVRPPGAGIPAGGAAVVIDPRRAPGHVTVTFHGQLHHENSHLPVSGVDLIVQQQAAPRAIYGGVRTDVNGRFSIDVAVPIGTHVVLRVPSHNHESEGRAFQEDREIMVWKPYLR